MKRSGMKTYNHVHYVGTYCIYLHRYMYLYKLEGSICRLTALHSQLASFT